MSNRLLTLAWNVRGLTPAEKIILVRLADRADQDGHCWPSHQSIADDCGLTERTVRDALPKIQSKGHLTIKQDTCRSSKGFSRYSYIVHPLTPEARSGVTPEASAADTGKRPPPHRRNSVPTPEAGAAPNMNLLNLVNHQGNQPPTEFVKLKGWQLRNDYRNSTDPVERAALKAEIERRKGKPAKPAAPAPPPAGKEQIPFEKRGPLWEAAKKQTGI